MEGCVAIDYSVFVSFLWRFFLFDCSSLNHCLWDLEFLPSAWMLSLGSAVVKKITSLVALPGVTSSLKAAVGCKMWPTIVVWGKEAASFGKAIQCRNWFFTFLVCCCLQSCTLLKKLICKTENVVADYVMQGGYFFSTMCGQSAYYRRLSFNSYL